MMNGSNINLHLVLGNINHERLDEDERTLDGLHHPAGLRAALLEQ